MTENTIRTVKVQKIINECDGVKTITFNMKQNEIKNYRSPKPGQFIMIWIPGVDEVPMSISGYDDKGNWSFTVKNVGECTNAIHNLKLGDFIGVRGPLGNNFSLPVNDPKKIFLIGGGTGMAPLKPLSSELIKVNLKFTIIEGAKLYCDLLYMDEFQAYHNKICEFNFCTDDGSFGKKGFASAIFEELIEEHVDDDFSNYVVYACGPELMLYKLLHICQNYKIDYYASLERLMRCGCGLCGLCALDPTGLLVCKDGPIFNTKELLKIEDFGKYARDFTGKKIPLC